MPTALSPIKSKRLDEKSTLQLLNGRLELYVMRVKEMEDAKNVAERELETIRQRMQADIDAIRLRLSRELEETRKKLDIELDQKARLQVLEQEQHVELVKLRSQVKELSEIKALAESLRVELTKEQANSKSSKETLSVQTTQLQSARRRIKDLERDNRSHEASLNDVTKELEDLRKKSADFDLTRDSEITTIRREMNQKHQEALAQWKKDTEERLQAVEKEVRHYFEGVVQGFKNQVEDLSLELDSTKSELDRTANDYEESLKVRQSLTEKVAHLEREYREERTKFKEDRKKYESTLEHFRSSKFAKEQEFNDLMDVKIALDAEITTYRRILDREETRVGLPTPTSTPNAKQTPRKRKSESSANGTAKRVKRAPSSVQIVHLDLEKDRIVLENTSDKAVSLAGWEVRGRSENQVFRFPSTYSMRPKSKMTVYSSKRNKNAKEERKPNEDSFLATKFSLNAGGDFAVLLTAEGVPVSTRAEGLSAEEVKALEAEIKADLDDDAPPGEGVPARALPPAHRHYLACDSYLPGISTPCRVELDRPARALSNFSQGERQQHQQQTTGAMKNTVITVIFSLVSTGCAFYAMVYPAWFYQHYRRDGNNVFQGYGIFAFYSTAALESPFYASETVLQYSDFCDTKTIPNYMLGDGDQFLTVLCGKGMMSVQATTATGAALSVVGLLGSIVAVFNPSAGYSERVVSFCTLVSSLLLAVSLVIWGWTIQQRLYQVDSINSAFSSCKADRTDWHCWFYGYSFWVCLASVIILSITGYLSSAGRAEKIRYFRKEYERDLAVAVQQSMEHDAAAQAHHLNTQPATAYARSNTAQNFALQQQQPYGQPYGQPQQFNDQQQHYDQQQQYGYNQQQQSGALPQKPGTLHSQEVDAAYPSFREEKNHTLLGRQPSGGVV